ncbi:hypothetical protein HDV05_005898 [Chytridiales sp. JEL 0842]|nr:hypothetical protein HDV05_005898 [Chytridiales sp. JEL 0842]
MTSTNPLSGPSTDLQTIKTQTEAVCKPGPNGKSCADVQKSSLDKLTSCLKTALSNPQESDKCACDAIGGIASEFRASCNIPSCIWLFFVWTQPASYSAPSVVFKEIGTLVS